VSWSRDVDGLPELPGFSGTPESSGALADGSHTKQFANMLRTALSVEITGA